MFQGASQTQDFDGCNTQASSVIKGTAFDPDTGVVRSKSGGGFCLSNGVDWNDGILTQVEFSEEFKAKKFENEHQSVQNEDDSVVESEELKMEQPDKELPTEYQEWLNEVRDFMPKFRNPESDFNWLDRDDICNIILTLVDKCDDLTDSQRQEVMGYLTEITNYSESKSMFLFHFTHEFIILVCG